MPTLLPPAKPRLTPARTSSTSGNRSATASADPSVEPLSTTTVSIPRSDSSAASVSSRPLYERTTATTFIKRVE